MFLRLCETLETDILSVKFCTTGNFGKFIAAKTSVYFGARFHLNSRQKAILNIETLGMESVVGKIVNGRQRWKMSQTALCDCVNFKQRRI